MATFKDIRAVEKRIEALTQWLKENAPECFVEQKQLDTDTRERVYWHYGYTVALRDVLRFLTEPEAVSQKFDTLDIHDSHPSA